MDKWEILYSKLAPIMSPNKVYFDPPSNLVLTYPCVIIEKVDILQEYSAGTTYTSFEKFKCTLIRKDPFGEHIYELLALPTAKYDRHYIFDNLHHDVFNIYI